MAAAAFEALVNSSLRLALRVVESSKGAPVGKFIVGIAFDFCAALAASLVMSAVGSTLTPFRLSLLMSP